MKKVHHEKDGLFIDQNYISEASILSPEPELKCILDVKKKLC